jgi:hypothetical protein
VFDLASAATVILTPVVGILGTVATAVTKYKMQQLENEARDKERAHELAMLAARSQAMLAETEANIRITQTIADAAVDIEEAKAFTASQHAAAAPALEKGVIAYMMGRGGLMGALGALLACGLGITDVIKALMRPLGTIYISGLATWVVYVSFEALERLDGAITPAIAEEVWKTAVFQVLTLFVTLWTWWYGDRRLAKVAAQKPEQHG